MRPFSRAGFLSAIFLFLFAFCVFYGVQSFRGLNAQGPDGAPQAMPVVYDVVKEQETKIWKEFSGRIKAVDSAEIRPQVSGRIMEIRFTEGQTVAAGDILFVIDPRPYEATLKQAEAELASAQAQAALAEKEYQRASELVKTQAIAQSVMDRRISERNAFGAAVKLAKAHVERAKIDLDYAYVKSPIAGRVGRAEITVGNLVETAAGAPLLTTVVSNEQVYADFDVDEQTYLTYIRSSAKDLNAENSIPVKLMLENDNKEYEGVIHTFDNLLDVSSGTIRARALFKNDDQALLPGMTVTVMMGSAETQKSIQVNEKAVGTDQSRKFVFVVSKENMTEARPVQLGEKIGMNRVILSGLQEGDKIITEGVIRLRPGMPVMPMTKEEMAEFMKQQAQGAAQAPQH